MAVHENFSAWIAVEDTPATEYQVTRSIGEHGETILTCWIASDNGKGFTVNWKDHAFSTPTEGVVSIDGHRCAGRVIEQANRAVSNISGVRSSDNARRPFMFANIVTTDDDRYLDTPPSPELGDITITITETRIRGHAPRRFDRAFQRPEILRPTQVHERSKKSAVHHAGFGNEMRIGPGSAMKLLHKTIGPPIVKFVFKYRSLDVLQADGIAPQARNQAPEPEYIYIDDDDDYPVPNRQPVKAENIKYEDTKPLLLPSLHPEIIEVIDLT